MTDIAPTTDSGGTTDAGTTTDSGAATESGPATDTRATTGGVTPVYGVVELAARIDKTPAQVEEWLEDGKLPAPTILTIGTVWAGDAVEAWITDEVDVSARARRAQEAATRRAQEAKLRPRAWQVAGNVAGAHARGLSEGEWLAEAQDPAAKRIAEGQDAEVVEALKGADLWPWT